MSSPYDALPRQKETPSLRMPTREIWMKILAAVGLLEDATPEEVLARLNLLIGSADDLYEAWDVERLRDVASIRDGSNAFEPGTVVLVKTEFRPYAHWPAEAVVVSVSGEGPRADLVVRHRPPAYSTVVRYSQLTPLELESRSK